MNHQGLTRFSPLELRGGQRLRNRVVVPPMASETADPNGCATEATLAHYKRLAASGAGLVLVEYSYVAASGRSEENQLGIASPVHLDGLTRIARVIQAAGAVAGIQLTHAGGKAARGLTGGRLQSPSGIAVPVKDRELAVPDIMTAVEVEEWKQAFGAAVELAVAAGFELVEFHAAHGYGLNQWLSPITNARDDAYGGAVERNSQLLFEIVAAARRAYPNLLLAVRIPGQDFLAGGLSSDDAVGLAQGLAELGVDLLDVSSGIGGWRRPRDRSGEGYLVSEAAVIAAAVSVPVIAVGGIEHGAYIDQGLEQGKFSLAAVGRAILKDPQLWGAENLCA